MLKAREKRLTNQDSTAILNISTTNGRKENNNSSRQVSRMVDVQTVSIAIASASIVLAAVYYVLQMRHQAKARQTDLIVRLYSLVGSKEFCEAVEKIYFREIKSVDDYLKKYGTVAEINQVWVVYGALGMLLRRKLVDVDIINDITGGTVIVMWEKLKPLFEPLMKERGIEWDSFEYLYDELKKREQRQ